MDTFVPGQLRQFERALLANPGLADTVIGELPGVVEQEHIVIRTDAVSTDAAICRALALAVEGIEAQIELKKGEHADCKS